jgi:hypothetical protein
MSHGAAFRDAFNSWEGHMSSKYLANRREETTAKFGARPPGGVKGGKRPNMGVLTKGKLEVVSVSLRS